ncbi:beta-ketoacyl synthase N-terminal-like domain-containing protein [Buchnera aphidicola (Mindarus keteleerifoliae)]|uniref:beta-ketoacyl synthase N-terminal-like domain-containing protein n=1 Tax=Buchnera aphidicola TaxID=9 RepID=UPI0031B6CBE3
MKRVVITGLGIISSIGNNSKDVLISLKKQSSGIVFSNFMKKIGAQSQIFGNIKNNMDILSKICNKKIRFMNFSSAYAYLTMLEAIKDANLKENVFQRNPRVGIIVGSSINFFSKFNLFKNKKITKQKKKFSTYSLIQTMTSNISSCLSTFFNIYGISYSISSACASSAHCIGNAYELIKCGKQDIIFSGGSESLNKELILKFDAMRVLSKKRNHNPKEASRAYDFDRDGFVISEGSGILVLEELNHAISRNAKIYAEIVGYGFSSDGKNMVKPSVKGIFQCMKLALNEINYPIDYLNTHATSTKVGDISELIAIEQIFKKKIPFISSTKSLTGHSLGSSGVHELIYSILMLKYGFIVPSINIFNLDPNAKKFPIVQNFINSRVNTIMSNSFGFGGTNASLIIKNFFLNL